MRTLKYWQAINEALHQLLESDERVFLIGQGCTSEWYIGGTCDNLLDRFGNARVCDTPISESAITGAAAGAAIAGLRPILVFPRMDFMLYAMDAIINQAAKWHYLFRHPVPMVIWCIINRKGCQGAQHSQDFTWLFKMIPGLKVVSPETPDMAKGLMIGAVQDNNPVVFIDDRERYNLECDVPEEMFKISVDPWDLHTVERGIEYHCPAPCAENLESEFYKGVRHDR